MIFLKDETAYFCMNEEKETQKRSFIGMKVILLHSYFHQSFRGFKFYGDADQFLESYQNFIESMKNIFKSNPSLLDYYITFSKISLLSISFMSNFQYRIYLLKKLISLKSNKLTFLNIHPSHSEIVYHVFIILSSSFISRRGPLHFYQNEKFDEINEEEEDEEANEDVDEANENNININEVKDFININDESQISKLTDYLKSQISYFSLKCKSKTSTFLDFGTKMIFRSLSDNGVLSITKDIKQLLLSIFGEKIDFSTINAEFIDRPFSQNISEIIKNIKLFDQIILQINKIIDCNKILFQDENLLYVANPQFFVVTAYLLKLGRIEKSTNCKYKRHHSNSRNDDNDDNFEVCTKHHEFIAVDWNSLIPKLTPSYKCPYCVINDEPSNLSLTTSFNNTVPMTYDFEKLDKDFKSDHRSIMYMNIYNAIEEDDLHPIELHLLRMIMIIAEARLKNKKEPINKHVKNQLAVCIASIAALLFPYTSFNLSATATILFIQNVLDKIKMLMLSHFNINQNDIKQTPTFREVRKLFSSSISPFMKGVFESLRKNVLNFNSKNEDKLFKEVIKFAIPSSASLSRKQKDSKVDDNDDDNNNDENYRLNAPLKPMGSKLFLRQFLLDPNLRRKCPVIYDYLRLNDRFDRTRFIGKLVPSLRLILNYAYRSHSKEAIGKSINTIDGIDQDFLKNWREAASDIEKDLLTEEARKCLNDTLVDEPTIASFLPRRHENWPVMTVILSLSDAQNKFINTLSRYSNIVIKDIDDFEIATTSEAGRDNYRIRNTVLNIPLMNAIKGFFLDDEFGFHCKFEEKQEKQFRNELSEYTYYYIVHKSLSLRATFNYNGEGIVAQFKHIVNSKPMTNQQLCYLSKLKKDGKGAGLMLLLENLMFRLIGTSKNTDGSKSIVEEIQETLLKKGDKNDDNAASCYHLTSIENDAFFEFVNAKNHMTDKLTLSQIPSIYEFLASQLDDAVIIELSIGAQLSKSLKDPSHSESFISAEMDKIENMSKNEWLDVANVIVLLMAKMNENNENIRNIQSVLIKDLYDEIKELASLSRTQNHTFSKVLKTFRHFDITDLSLIYEYCMTKSI